MADTTSGAPRNGGFRHAFSWPLAITIASMLIGGSITIGSAYNAIGVNSQEIKDVKAEQRDLRQEQKDLRDALAVIMQQNARVEERLDLLLKQDRQRSIAPQDEGALR